MLEESTASTVEPRSTSLRGRVFIAAILLLIPVVYFYPAVIGSIMLAPGDGWQQIFGIRMLIGQMIRDGQLPLWNPYIFSGMPLLASIQPGALYPPTWLFALLSPQTAMNWMVITTYHVALVGTYLYARRIGASRVGSIVAGVVFAFGGYMIAHLGHPNRIAAAAWLPWIVLAIEELYLQARWRWVALGAVFVALQLFAGEPQMTCYTVMVAGAYGFVSLTLREERESRRRFLFAAIAMSVCAALLSAIQFLPERELLRQGERAGLSYEYFSSFSFPPQHLFQLVFPYFFGGAGMKPYSLIYWGRWTPTETAGYVGMLALMLALIALAGQFGEKRDRLVWFWAACALMALMLAFGSYLPFRIHRVLYRVPVYNLFRASGRHLFEFNFALAVLAGIGATRLAEKYGRALGRMLLAGIGGVAIIVAVTAVAYRFLAERLVMELPVSAGAKSVANPEFYIPVGFFALGAVSLGLYPAIKRWPAITGGLMVAVLLADLASFGAFYEWTIVPRDLPQKLADRAAVRWIKEREPDWNSFRILSHSATPYERNYESLNFPNVSIVRGLQSANGYDPLVLLRYSALAGEMGLDGIVRDTGAFDLRNQSFNLLNVKYLLFERSDTLSTETFIEHDGVRFNERPIDLAMTPGRRIAFTTGATASELALVTAMGRSDHLPNGTLAAKVTIRTRDGRAIERQLLVGRDTSEWAYDREDVRAAIKHDRARVAESFPVANFQGHRYLARVQFDRAAIERVEIDYALGEAELTLARISLHDAETGQSFPLKTVDLPAERWRKAAGFGEIEIYENTKALPRAWFARRAVVMPSEDILATIKTGRMKDGAAFDPTEVALLGVEDVGKRINPLPAGAVGDVTVTHYGPHRIELQTRNAQAGILVLSEIYYRGWEAWIDRRRAPVERVDYALRGLAVPAGDHRVEFAFRAPSFWKGAVFSLLGVGLLLIGGARRIFARRRSARRSM